MCNYLLRTNASTEWQILERVEETQLDCQVYAARVANGVARLHVDHMNALSAETSSHPSNVLMHSSARRMVVLVKMVNGL